MAIRSEGQASLAQVRLAQPKKLAQLAQVRCNQLQTSVRGLGILVHTQHIYLILDKHFQNISIFGVTPCSAALYYVIVNNLLKFAFRLNTIMDSSRVMVLDAGRIRQVTQHSEKSDFPLYEFFFTKNYRDKRILIPSPENSTLRRCCSRTKGPFSTEW